MNPIVRDKQDITHVTYANRKINYYIKKNKIAKKDRTILKKYVETAASSMDNAIFLSVILSPPIKLHYAIFVVLLV